MSANLKRLLYVYPFKDTSELTKLMVWNKGSQIDGFDAAIWRRDMCGHAMCYSEHGNTASEYGWEIDHIFPSALGGQTVIENLEPLYWLNNREKGDTYPWFCGN